MKNPLIGAGDMDIARAKDLVDAIVNNKIFIVVNEKNYNCAFLQKDESYISQFTYVLIKWGYVSAARGEDQKGHLCRATPNQCISSSLNRFMNDAREAGLTDNTRDWSGASFDTVWI